MDAVGTISIAVPVWDEHGNQAGSTMVDAECLHRIGDYAVTPARPTKQLGTFVVTHVPSGRAAPGNYKTVKDAALIADAFAVVMAGRDPRDVPMGRERLAAWREIQAVAERARLDEQRKGARHG